jgi:two-component system response regulator AtoC
MKERILVIEDERTALQALAFLLTEEGYEVLKAESGETGLRSSLEEKPDLILLDIRLPGIDGLEVLQKLRAEGSDAAVIIMTADATSSTAIRATQYGAFDYMAKPINDNRLLFLIRRALEYRKLEQEVRTLRQSPERPDGVPGMVGHSLAMQEVYKMIGRVSSSEVTVLITGESGTGKELVANAIHAFSRHAQGPFIKVNCAAIPQDLMESELFGHEKGAFTGASSRQIGRFEQAKAGSLLLDEISELPLGLQAKLLRALQDRTIEPVGRPPVTVDFRLIAATAQNLEPAVAEGRFRADLYYRLNVVTIRLPPLRERREDISLLVQHFLGRSEHPVTIRRDALEQILAHDWPGNVRELENLVTRAIVLAPGGVITPECLQFSPSTANPWNAGLDGLPYSQGFWEVIRKVERALLQSALSASQGNKTEAARMLKIQRRLLYQKMAELGLR